MSTLAEIEAAIEKLPPKQWQEIRRWMESCALQGSVAVRAAELAEFDRWLATSTGLAKGRLTTDERMRETRGED